MEVAEEINGKSSETMAEEVPQKKQESRDEVLSRHRKEISDLQSKETEMKKAAAKGSKAEQKAKKKHVEEEITRLSGELKERHSGELASLGYTSVSGNEKGASLDTLVKAIAGVSVANHHHHHHQQPPEQGKSSKGMKRREKRAQEEAARERRIQEEQSGLVSDRAAEDERLGRKLGPLGLAVREVKPDGHCLYRAVEDQLGLLSGGGPPPHDFRELRGMAAAYMREHAADFIPFFLSEKEGDGTAAAAATTGGGTLPERFERYCEEVETTAAWGGHLELEALTRCLGRRIAIFSGSFPDVEMGKEYDKGSEGSVIRLSFHRHAFGLGEHYNSVVPI